MALSEKTLAKRGLQVEFHRVGLAQHADFLHESRRRIDIPRCADGDEQRTIVERFADVFLLKRHFAEPNDMGPHGARVSAYAAHHLDAQVARMGAHIATGIAAGFAQFAMHMDKIPAAGTFMQIVDILGHDQDFGWLIGLKVGNGFMRCVRSNLWRSERLSPDIIKCMNPVRILGEGLGSRDIFDIVLRPNSIFIAKGCNSRFRRNPGPSQNNDVAVSS